LQLIPQDVPLQVAAPFVGLLHMLHAEPQHVVVLLAAHVVPLTWNPVLQLNPQEVPLQVAAPFVGPVHMLQAEPQQVVVLLAAQVVPLTW